MQARLIQRGLVYLNAPLGNILAAVVFHLALLLLPASHAAAVTWTNPEGGSWSVATNWSTARIPTASDDVSITLPGNYFVTLDVNATVASLTLGSTSGEQTLTNSAFALALTGPSTINSGGILGLSGGSLVTAGLLTIDGQLIWNAGSWSATALVTPEGNLFIGGAVDKSLAGEISNQGTITWSGTHNITMSNSRIINLAGGLIDILNHQTISLYNGSPKILNTGTIRKSSPGGITTFAVPIDNSGLLEAQSGTLEYANGSTFQSGSTFLGAGTNSVSNGNVTFDGSIVSGNLHFSGATIIGTNAFSGTTRWTAGVIQQFARVSIPTNSTLHIIGTVDRMLQGVLNNSGLVTWSGANSIFMSLGGAFNNLEEGLFQIENNQQVTFYNGAPRLNNSGTIRKISSGLTTFQVMLNNSGFLDAQSGILEYASGSLFQSGSTFLGAGTNSVSNGNVTFDGSIVSHNLQFSGATIMGTNAFSGTTRWTAGIIEAYARISIVTNSILHITGDLNRILQGVMNNSGLVTWSGSNSIFMALGGTFNNLEEGLFQIENNQQVAFYNGTPRFNNSGTIRKVSSGLTIFQVVLNNSGLLEAQSGILEYAAGSLFQSGSTFLGAGTNSVSNGNVTFDGSIVSDNLQFSGAIIMGTNAFSGTTRWTAGVIQQFARVSIPTNSALHIIGSADRVLQGVLSNSGLVTWAGPNNIFMALGSTFNNSEGGLFQIENNQQVAFYNGAPRLNNSGTIRKISSGLTTFQIMLNNSGLLEVESGILEYAGGSIFQSGSTFLGAGTNAVSNGNVTFDGSIVSDNLQFSGATIIGTNVFSGATRWTAGIIDSSARISIATNSSFHITGTTDRMLRGVLNNSGLVTWSGANKILFSVMGTINNLSNGIFDIQNDQTMAFYNGTGTFNNSGRLRKSAGTGLTVLSSPIAFNNVGIVDAKTGTIAFGTFTQTGGRLALSLTSLSDFGRIQFMNPVALNGTLEVNLRGYQPRVGDTFVPITYPSRTGAFENFDLPPEALWQTGPSIYGPTSITLSVLNGRPTLEAIADKTVSEEILLSFTATAAEPDAGQTTTFSLLDAPAGSQINPVSGVFSWTPTEAQGPSTNLIVVQVSDNGVPFLSHTQHLHVVVTEVNRIPVLAPIITQTVNELTTASIAAVATDPDLPANQLTYELLSPPSGAVIHPQSGVISWTATEAQGPSTNLIIVIVRDNGDPLLSATNVFTIVIKEVNLPPVLALTEDQVMTPGDIWTHTHSATDPDLPANLLAFSLVSGPTNAVLDPSSGTLEWTPDLSQVGTTNQFTISVQDNGTPPLTTSHTYQVIVLPLPSLSLTITGLGSVTVSWAAAYEAYLLQTATNLAPPYSWTPATNQPVKVGTNYVVPLNSISSGQYFQLIHSKTLR